MSWFLGFLRIVYFLQNFLSRIVYDYYDRMDRSIGSGECFRDEIVVNLEREELEMRGESLIKV